MAESAAEYLQKHGIHEAIAAAIATVTREVPYDPIDAIGRLLLERAKVEAKRDLQALACGTRAQMTAPCLRPSLAAAPPALADERTSAVQSNASWADARVLGDGGIPLKTPSVFYNN